MPGLWKDIISTDVLMVNINIKLTKPIMDMMFTLIPFDWSVWRNMMDVDNPM